MKEVPLLRLFATKSALSSGRIQSPFLARPRPLLALPLALILLLPLSCRGPRKSPSPLCSVGSEVMDTAMDDWRTIFHQESGIDFVHEGRGNGTAPAVLETGTCDLAPMSRPMTDGEVDSIVHSQGAIPLAIPVAMDALAVVTRSPSPVHTISMETVRRLFEEAPEKASVLFPEFKNSDQKISVLGLNSASDRYRWFKNAALASGHDYSDRVQEISGPLTLVDRIASDTETIGFGYARMAELKPGVTAIAIQAPEGIYAPDEKTIQSRAYPYTRYLYIYIRAAASHRKNRPESLQFLNLILSEKGQAILRPLGLYPLSEQDRQRSLQMVHDAGEIPSGRSTSPVPESH